MAKILALPELSVIKGFKGVLDFYVNMGIPCVRRWPRSPSRPRSPAVVQSAAIFAQFSKAASDMDPFFRESARIQASGTPLTWKDYTTVLAYGRI